MIEGSAAGTPRRLNAERITIRAGGSVLIDGVDCGIPPGSVTALVGPNGAGKSTLLRALAAVQRPDSGSVRIVGGGAVGGSCAESAGSEDLFALARRDRARLIAFVEQDSATDTAMTVTSVVGLGRIPHQSIWGGDDRESARAIADALYTVGLSDFAEREFASLSGGERQRVMLARALAQQPGILLLDEPTNHLDVAAQLAVLGLLRSLSSDGMTVLAALHDLGLAASYSDHVIVLSGGRVVATGPTTDTLTPELIRDVYGVLATRITNPATGRIVLAFDPLPPDR